MNGRRGKSVRKRAYSMGYHNEFCCNASFKRSAAAARFAKRRATRRDRRAALKEVRGE